MRPEIGPAHLRPTLPFQERWAEGGPTYFVRETDRSEGGPSNPVEWAECAALLERPTDHLTFGPVRRRAHLARHRCSEWALVGLDDETAALTAWVDPYPLTLAGEVGALTDHRPTYHLRGAALERRDRWNIPTHPAGSAVLVLAEHRCGQPIPASWRAAPTRQPTPPAPSEGIAF